MDIRATTALPQLTTVVRPDRTQRPSPSLGLPKLTTDPPNLPVPSRPDRTEEPKPSERVPVFTSASGTPQPTLRPDRNRLPGEQVPVPFWKGDEPTKPNPSFVGPPPSTETPRFTSKQPSESGEDKNVLSPTSPKSSDFVGAPRLTVEDARRVLIQVKSGDYDQLPRATQAKLGKLKKATQDLEALMLKDLIGKMRADSASAKPDPMKQLAHDMFDEQLASSVSQTGRVGIANVVFDRLSSQIVNADLTQGLLGQGRIDLQG